MKQIPSEYSRVCAGTQAKITEISEQAVLAGFLINYDGEAGTMVIYEEGATEADDRVIYKAIRKGGHGQPWIVRLDTRCFQ